jgi:ArsR family transcriptional regulator
MEAAGHPTRTSAPLLDELGLLADATRTRILAVLDRQELTVAELCEVVALPQSTVSRHLKALADAGWVAARRDGTRRYYRGRAEQLDASSRRLWELVREDVDATPTARHDGQRLSAVLERRSTASAAFFTTAAAEWDALRGELFGATSDLRLLPSLLDPDLVVADLGCGSGHVAVTLAPFVARVIGVDSSTEMLAVARSRARALANVELRHGSLERLPLEDASLDLALCVLVLHHVADPARALAEAARTIAPGGRLVVSDMLPHDHEEYRSTMGHVWLGFDRETIEQAVSAAGLQVERHVELPAEAGARGPGLFVLTARRPLAAAVPITASPSRGGTP